MNFETEWTEPLEIEETRDPNYVEPLTEPENDPTTSPGYYFLEPETASNEVTAAAPEATEEMTVITMEDLQSIGLDIVHADLFGSFLICGTLIALALFRGIHGT